MAVKPVSLHLRVITFSALTLIIIQTFVRRTLSASELNLRRRCWLGKAFGMWKWPLNQCQSYGRWIYFSLFCGWWNQCCVNEGCSSDSAVSGRTTAVDSVSCWQIHLISITRPSCSVNCLSTHRAVVLLHSMMLLPARNYYSNRYSYWCVLFLL